MSAEVGRRSLRTGLGRVRGLGSARDGVAHWWAQRVTAVALVPLTLWFVFSVAQLAGAGASQDAVRAWIAAPVPTVLLLLLIVATFQHLSLGLQTVIEDYIHHEETKLAVQLAQKFACVALALAAIVAVLRIAL
jgi:succinate dehydrogenase / fumarate reductase membrane anchor subunit